jgi:hypothetical protein
MNLASPRCDHGSPFLPGYQTIRNRLWDRNECNETRESFTSTFNSVRNSIITKDNDDVKNNGKKKVGIVNQTDIKPSPVLASHNA